MARFSGIPSLPQSGVEEWNLRTLSALKQNVELLTGSRGESDLASKALIKSQFTVNQPPLPTITSASTVGPVYNSFNYATVKDTSGTDRQFPYFDTDMANVLNTIALIAQSGTAQDIQRLTNDIAQLRNTLNILIAQIKA
jgi:hypothetical protein